MMPHGPSKRGESVAEPIAGRYRLVAQTAYEKICAENNTNLFDYHMPVAEKPDF